MQNSISMEQLTELRGSPVYSQDGNKIGSVEEIFYDANSNSPEWIGVGTGFFGMKRVLVPVTGASLDADGVTVPYAKDMVKDSPSIDGDEISDSTEQELYAYYGLHGSTGTTGRTDYDTTTDTTRTTEYTGTSGYADTTRDVDVDRNLRDDTITRSEEELAVGKREVEAGRVRVRKWVETEPVQADVTLRHEEAHITREPINEVVSGASIGEDEIDVTLRGEEAVVDKRVVAKERIGIDVDATERTETVSDEVRRERVDVDESAMAGKFDADRGDVLDRDSDRSLREGGGDSIRDRIEDALPGDRDRDGR